MMGTVPCSKCGLSTNSPTGICHRHTAGQRAFTRPTTSEQRYGAPPTSSSVRVTQASVQAQADLTAVFPESADGVISPERARQIAVEQLRNEIVTFAAHTFMDPEMDTLDPEQRDRKAAEHINSLGKISIKSFSDFEDDRVKAKELREYPVSTADQALSRALYLSGYALRKEHQIGRDAGATSSEGINYASVEEAEFVDHVMNASMRAEAQTHYRRCLASYSQIFSHTTGRQPKTSVPIAEGLIVDDDFENPLGKIGEWTDSFEVDLIQDHEKAVHQERLEAQMRAEEERRARSEKRAATAKAVVGTVTEVTRSMSEVRQQNRAARARNDQARRAAEAQDAMIRMGNKLAPKPWWKP